MSVVSQVPVTHCPPTQHAALLKRLRFTLLCPISGRVMQDPVTLGVGADDETFDRDSVERWWRTCENAGAPPTHPVSGAPLRRDQCVVFPDSERRDQISEALEEAMMWARELRVMYTCPLTGRLMWDPVTVGTRGSATVERAAAQRHFDAERVRAGVLPGLFTDPVSGATIEDTRMSPNWGVRACLPVAGATLQELDRLLSLAGV